MLRIALSPRWILWHVLTLGAMVTCGLLASWQWGKAGSALGSALNVGYGLQWPVFALFFGYMWWRMLRLEARRQAGPGATSDPLPAPEPVPALLRRPPPRPAALARQGPADDEDPDDLALSAYNRMLAELASRHRDD